MTNRELDMQYQIELPTLLDTTFDLADRIAPAMDRIRRASDEGELRRFDPTLVVSGAFLFAGYLVTKFCEEFAKALGNAMAKSLVDQLFSKKKQPSETARILDEVTAETRRLQLTCSTPRELQIAIDQALTSVQAVLIAQGMRDSDARQLTAAVADTFASKINI